ncbi:Transposon Ty3-G Gag-Pol polyprotein [Labeo rohita]|uniref:ribonuclease H n=1 Tax=Labeo rohita TaxID=84645 RepID=A0ABQ8MHN7_LABRO|nr:Transposon Ty3-G Gag-Pol polyprotein [Labeo rohita]
MRGLPGSGACGIGPRGGAIARIVTYYPCVCSAPGRLSSPRRKPSSAFPAGPVPLPPRRSGGCTHGVRNWIWWRIRCPALGIGSPRCGFFPPRGSASTLPISSSEEVDVVSVDEAAAPQFPQYEELLEVVTRAVAKLSIDWPAEPLVEPQKSKLDERFLRSRPPPARRSLPFFPDLHTEVSRSWNSPFSSRLFIPASYNYGYVAGLDERGLRVTSALVGKGYTAAGQAGACPHTMSVLQAYQADLLKELDEGEEIKDSDISELRRTADLSLRATKETTHAIGRSMAALVAAERHLWLTLSDMKEKDRVFLLDAPLCPLVCSATPSMPSSTDTRRHVSKRRRFSGSSLAAIQLTGLLRRSSPGRLPAPHTGKLKSRAWPLALLPIESNRRGPRPSGPDGSGPPRAAPSGGKRVAPQYSVSGSPLCPREIVLPTLPVLQGAAVSSEHSPQFFPPGNVAGLGSSPPPRGSLGPLVQVLPAGQPFQDTVPAAHITPEASLERLRGNYCPMCLLGSCILERGYRIQFGAPPPPFNGVSPTLVGPEQGLVMEQEVATLLRKEAIEVVPPHERESGFYSRYFIVPKKDGGLRPILDLRLLNRSVKRLKFKMLTIKQVVSQIRSEDWFVTIDLKDAYFHVSILPQHRKFLRFAFRGEAYQYRVLPFGLALSPRTFTKCVDAALAPLRLQGIRILNYIDDWLILAQSEMVAVRHRDVVLTHMKALGLRLNAKKSVLSPLQRTTYLGVVWDSTTMQARLSPARIESILTAVKRVQEGRSLTVKQFQQLLGLMAAASNVISFGLLYMRPLQWWLKTKGFSPRGNPLRMIRVTRRCLRALDMWRKPWFLSQGPVLGAPCRRVTPATDASLTGWGAVMSGHPARGLWSGRQLTWHINCLEMLAVFRALKHFLPDLRDRHVLVHTDNTSVVSYINHQGGLRSRPLYKLAHQILVWSQDKLLSLRAVYVPGHLNLGADILSRQGPRPGEWMLHLEVVKQIWRVFGPAQGEHAMSPLVLSSSSSSPGAGCHGADVAEATSVRFSPDRSAPGSSRESVPGRDVPSSSSPVLARPSMVLGLDFSPRRLSLGDSRQERSPLTGRGLHSSPPAGAVEALGVASEGAHLLASGLSTEVVETILQSRAPSTRKLYALKWKLFTSWCGRRQQDPVNCPVGSVLEFLQGRLSAGLSHSTLKVYVAAIAAYHAPLGGLSVGRDPLVTRFRRWIVDAICSAYEASDLPPPLGVRAHSTRSMAASTAFLAGVPMQDICNAAGWSTPLTFVRFYELDLRHILGRDWGLAAWASRSQSVSTRLEFLKGNVSADARSGARAFMPMTFRSSIGLIAHVIQSAVTLKAFPKRFDAASRSLRGTGVTYVT